MFEIFVNIFIDKILHFNQMNNIRAEKVIRDSVAWAMGAGLVPIPVVDMVAVTAIQIDMLKQLASLYQVDFSETRLKSWIAALSSGVMSKVGAGMIKFIPFIGTVVGGLSMSVLSGASTYAVGQVFVRHFESGGTLLDFDVNKFKEFYLHQFEVGREFIENLSKETIFGHKETEEPSAATNENTATNGSDVGELSAEAIKRLKELADLYEKGVLTTEEFKTLKDKILKDGEYK
jgi:uncharacterized protein (DUF697 family)